LCIALRLCLQEDVDNLLLSSAQLETLVYSNMRFSGPRLPGSGEHSSTVIVFYTVAASLAAC
jgi:hypothetical protein